jgi:F0F1-type ATP synthase membrane subunit b/b'
MDGLESTAKVMGIILGSCTILGWVISAFLNNRKETISNRLKIEDLQEDLRELKKEVDTNRREAEHYRNEKRHY